MVEGGSHGFIHFALARSRMSTWMAESGQPTARQTYLGVYGNVFGDSCGFVKKQNSQSKPSGQMDVFQELIERIDFPANSHTKLRQLTNANAYPSEMHGNLPPKGWRR
jgi:hypothetical protein